MEAVLQNRACRFWIDLHPSISAFAPGEDDRSAMIAFWNDAVQTLEAADGLKSLNELFDDMCEQLNRLENEWYLPQVRAEFAEQVLEAVVAASQVAEESLVSRSLHELNDPRRGWIWRRVPHERFVLEKPEPDGTWQTQYHSIEWLRRIRIGEEWSEVVRRVQSEVDRCRRLLSEASSRLATCGLRVFVLEKVITCVEENGCCFYIDANTMGVPDEGVVIEGEERPETFPSEPTEGAVVLLTLRLYRRDPHVYGSQNALIIDVAGSLNALATGQNTNTGVYRCESSRVGQWAPHNVLAVLKRLKCYVTKPKGGKGQPSDSHALLRMMIERLEEREAAAKVVFTDDSYIEII